MKTRLIFAALFALTSVMAQHGGEAQHSSQPRSNQGRVPAPPAKRGPGTRPQAEHSPTGHVNSLPHVRNDRWYGHDAPNDRRFQLSRPFEHGRFEHFGPSFRYEISRIDPNLHRFWLADGFYFDIAAWDWPLAVDWCWTCGDDFVIYEDPDHFGWYLLYNLHTGLFVHAVYMGR